MDNEKYTVSFIDSAEDYIYKLQYLAQNKRTTLRALSTYRILHWLYSWADWFEVTEANKLKIEKLMNCLILRNSSIVLPEIIPQQFYTNVSSPQNMWTWRILQNNANVHVVTNLGNKTLTVQSSNSIVGVNITVSKLDTQNNKDGTTSFTRIYNFDESVQLTAPSLLISGKIFDHWTLDGVAQTTESLTLSVTMDTNHTAIAVYRDPVPPLGSIKISKEILDSNGDPVINDTTSFVILIEKDNIGYGSIISYGNDVILTDLELGTYTITEEPNEDYTIESDNPLIVTLTEGVNQNQLITITNKQIDNTPTVGTVTVYKTLEGLEANELFIYALYGTNYGKWELGTLAEPAVFDNVPFGTYTLEETLDDRQQGLYVLNTIEPNDGQNVKVGSFTLSVNNANQEVYVTNSFNIPN